MRLSTLQNLFKKMQIICEVFLSKHTGSNIAQVLNMSLQMIHPLLTGMVYDIKRVIKVCYECLMDSDYPKLYLL